MYVPIEISYKNLENKDAVRDLIYNKAKKLEQRCDHISSLRITVTREQIRHQHMDMYYVRLDINIPPSHNIAIREKSARSTVSDDVFAVIRKAFEVAMRRVEEIKERQNGKVKIHPEQQTQAIVTKLFHNSEYGFLQTIEDGREVYFHKNSVHNNDFERLTIGTGVRFVEEAGKKGSQATIVQIVDKPGVRHQKV